MSNKIVLTEGEINYINGLEDDNAHTERLLWLALRCKNKRLIRIMKAIKEIHGAEGFIPSFINSYRETIGKEIQEYYSISV